jgi:hypothetical protein
MQGGCESVSICSRVDNYFRISSKFDAVLHGIYHTISTSSHFITFVVRQSTWKTGDLKFILHSFTYWMLACFNNPGELLWSLNITVCMLYKKIRQDRPRRHDLPIDPPSLILLSSVSICSISRGIFLLYRSIHRSSKHQTRACSQVPAKIISTITRWGSSSPGGAPWPWRGCRWCW